MTSPSHILSHMNILNFTQSYIGRFLYVYAFFMDPQLLLSQAVDLERPPIQLEVETELATPGKSGRGQSSLSRGPLPNARARDRGLALTRCELHEFHDSMKGELEDVKAMVKQLLEEMQKRTTGPFELPAT